MKIIIGATSYYSPNISGAGISTHLLVVYLKSKGHQVYVITPGIRLKNYTEESQLGSIKLYRLKSIRNPLREGLFIPVMPGAEVKRIIHNIKPDIVHIQDPMPMNMALQKEAHKMGIPVVLTNHFTVDYVLSYINSFLQPILEPLFLKTLVNFYNKCDIITCPTQTIVDTVKAIGVTKPVVALSNGVDIGRFKSEINLARIRRKFNIPANKVIILYLGRLDRDKSIFVLIRSIEKVLKKVDAHFVIAGSGDLEDDIKEYINSNNLTEFTTLTGKIDYESDDLVGLYKLADIFTIISSVETQSMATLEAMAASKPIVAANAGALPELVFNNKNGFLFDPGDGNELANYLVILAKDKELRLKMGKESLKRVAKHDLNKCQEGFKELYQNILSDHYDVKI